MLCIYDHRESWQENHLPASGGENFRRHHSSSNTPRNPASPEVGIQAKAGLLRPGTTEVASPKPNVKHRNAIDRRWETPLYNPFTEVTSSWAQQSRCACTAVSVRMLHATPTTTHHPLMYTGDAPPTSQQNVGAISISRRHGHTRNSASTTENKRSKTNGHRITAGQRCREGPAEVASKKAHISPPPLSLSTET